MDAFQGWWQWEEFWVPLAKLIAAFFLTMPIAWEREHSTRIMGLRTFSLVSMASCGYVLIANQVVGSDADPQARIIQGLMTGIGFIGGGAILKHGANVRGTATASSIWMTGALGAAVGYSEIEVAVLLSGLNYLTLRVLTPLGERRAESRQTPSGEDDPEDS
ncbi:MAG TPA: MgtC/SapB family protein [Thermoanaerobaculia bacterium]|nr:MgtC/SapB family protein [Thermoanaerobaculia bacterium]